MDGEVLTKPVTFSGKRLVLNYATSAVGEVKVELLQEGKPAGESETVYGDELDRDAVWKGGLDVATLRGRPVQLRFVLKDADVYAFRFAE
jgi:hypothetical protein